MKDVAAQGPCLSFIVPPMRRPAGGVQVIYQMVQAINEMTAGVRAEVVVMEHIHHVPGWFQAGQVAQRRRWTFRADQDLIVVPEYAVARFVPELRRPGLPYAIFVQNGYVIHKYGARVALEDAYRHADFILAISQDVIDCVACLYPQLPARVLRCSCVLDDLFQLTAQPKRNLICYMPRKLAEHSEFVVAGMRARLGPGWEIQAIDRLPLRDVATLLQQSRLFLAFGDQEGLQLPPLEAAACGNLVLGYHGEGGREYWHPPLFRPVEKGNLLVFIREALQAVDDLDSGGWQPSTVALAALRQSYSAQTQQAHLRTLLEHVQTCFAKRTTGGARTIDLTGVFAARFDAIKAFKRLARRCFGG